MKKPDMSVRLGRIEMANPVMVASGTFGYGSEYAGLVNLTRLGAIVVKGIRLEPWPGNPLPRMVEVPAGLVNAIGLQGPGVQGFVETHMPFLRQAGTPVIVNIWGTSLAEYGEVAARFDEVPGIAGLELNVSCPNVREGGASFGADPRLVAEVVAEVRRRTRLPLLTKLAPNVPDIKKFAIAAQEAGSDALSVSNTIPAMVIDVESRRPVLANRVGGLSGPALHPVAVKLVWECASVVQIPIVGMGGIFEARDALEFLIAGASAVAVGTANFIDPGTSLRVLGGIQDYMQRHGFDSMSQLVGSLEA